MLQVDSRFLKIVKDNELMEPVATLSQIPLHLYITDKRFIF